MEEDAKKYGFRYGATFYNPLLSNIPVNLHSLGNQARGIVSIHWNRQEGRKDFLLNLKAKLKPCGIKCDFRIVDETSNRYTIRTTLVKLTISRYATSRRNHAPYSMLYKKANRDSR